MHPEYKIFGHPVGAKLMIVGLLAVLGMMFGWWRDIVSEAEHEGYHKPIVQLSHRYGMVLFIASEVMFFSAFFWAFFSSSLYPVGGVWPPKGIVPLEPFHIPLLNTFILLLSGTTVTWAHHALIENDRKGLVWGLVLTVLLGLSFTSLQAFEYAHATFAFKDGIYPSTFYMATGFHGAHVIIGTIFLAVCLFRALKGHFKPDHHFGFEAAAWYWHFVDVVWLFLFVCIYWWGA
jgi:cytochrome c oxidase subunit 3